MVTNNFQSKFICLVDNDLSSLGTLPDNKQEDSGRETQEASFSSEDLLLTKDELFFSIGFGLLGGSGMEESEKEMLMQSIYDGETVNADELDEYLNGVPGYAPELKSNSSEDLLLTEDELFSSIGFGLLGGSGMEESEKEMLVQSIYDGETVNADELDEYLNGVPGYAPELESKREDDREPSRVLNMPLDFEFYYNEFMLLDDCSHKRGEPSTESILKTLPVQAVMEASFASVRGMSAGNKRYLELASQDVIRWIKERDRAGISLKQLEDELTKSVEITKNIEKKTYAENKKLRKFQNSVDYFKNQKILMKMELNDNRTKLSSSKINNAGLLEKNLCLEKKFQDCVTQFNESKEMQCRSSDILQRLLREEKVAFVWETGLKEYVIIRLQRLETKREAGKAGYEEDESVKNLIAIINEKRKSSKLPEDTRIAVRNELVNFFRSKN